MRHGLARVNGPRLLSLNAMFLPEYRGRTHRSGFWHTIQYKLHLLVHMLTGCSLAPTWRVDYTENDSMEKVSNAVTSRVGCLATLDTPRRGPYAPPVRKRGSACTLRCSHDPCIEDRLHARNAHQSTAFLV